MFSMFGFICLRMSLAFNREIFNNFILFASIAARIREKRNFSPVQFLMQFYGFGSDNTISRISRIICFQEPIDGFLKDLPGILQSLRESEDQRNIIVEGVLYKILTYFIEVIDCIEQCESEFSGYHFKR